MNDTGSAANAKGTNVQVAVRCRPVNAEERKSGQPSVVTCDSENKNIKISYGPTGKKQIKNFTFDKVFGNIHSDEDAGIVPRSVKAILENLESSGSEFTIRVSFLELYNEELQDLLNISGDKKLKLCEDVKKGVVCQNLEEITVLSVRDIFEILQRGIQQRQTAATLCNKNSSRSHSIFTMKIMIKECNRLTKKTIMKEYLAEVETLKMQLMQTREKNGVYMAADEFYAMETRLAAQESQLEECESALTQRTEEIKLVRRERDEYFAGYESTKQQLTVVAAELDEARVTLDEAKETVTGAYVELSATEAVVSEQLQTESKLLQQGQSLQKDLSHAQSDVNRLLDKVQRAAQSEEQKLRETQQFVSQLTASSQQLSSQVQGLSQRSAEHAETLNAGVAQMLQQGRSTCSSLQNAISAALTTMIGDAESARDEMTASCSGLKTHLHNTNSHLETTLRSLQGQLSEWLGEVDHSMRHAQEQLAAQDKQIAVASATITQHCLQLQNLSCNFLLQQQSLRDQSLLQAEQLQSELKAQFDSYEHQAQESSSEASVMLKSQAAAMENAMKSMLQELVSKGSAAFASSAARSASLCTSATQRLDQGISILSAAQRHIQHETEQHDQSVSALLTATTHQFTSDMSIVAEQRATADSTLSTVSGMVGTKRKYLDETVTELCAHVDEAIAQGVTVVENTSATANKVLSDVSQASQAMNSTA
eukprot:gene9650-11342_t